MLKAGMKLKTIIGIDYSLTSPAVCINNGNLMFYYLTNKKKWQGMMDESIVGYEHKEWTDPIQRFTQISDFTLDIITVSYTHLTLPTNREV